LRLDRGGHGGQGASVRVAVGLGAVVVFAVVVDLVITLRAQEFGRRRS
jgi:hypothetical protein